MSFRFLQAAWNFIKTGELPHYDHGHVDGLDEEDTAIAVDTNVYAVPSNLHPRDLKHSKNKHNHEEDPS